MPRMYIIAAVILGLMAFAYWYGDRNFDAGYNAHKAEQSDATELAVEAEQQRVSDELNKVIARKEHERKAALQLVSVLRKSKNRIVYRDIKILATPDCTNLGPDFVELFNSIIGEPPGGRITGDRDGGTGNGSPTRVNPS